MIIQSVRAQNVLKYTYLVLNQLPEKGLIAVSGRNESGKTAVVETICFALFGRTFSIPEDRLEKVIRWGESSCQVELTFRANDHHIYKLERSLDYKGTHAAQLKRDGEDEPFAVGPHTVAEAIYDISGFDFQQYLDALYLAQREISTPHSQSDTIKAIAGATDLEAVREELTNEIDRERERIDEINADVEKLLAEIDGLAVSEQALKGLDTEKHALNDRIHDTQKEIVLLEKAADEIQDSCPKLQDVGKALTTATLDTSLSRWREMTTQLEEKMDGVRTSCAQIETDSELCTENSDLNRFIGEMRKNLDAFEDVRDRMDDYRIQLAALLGEESASNDELHTEEPLPRQRRAVQRELGNERLKNFLNQAVILLTVVLALFCLTGWWQISFQPDKDLAGWFEAFLGGQFGGWDEQKTGWLKYAAIGAGAGATLMIFLSMGTSRRIRSLKQREAALADRFEDIKARATLIDEAEQLPFPRLVEGLDRLNNEGINRLLKDYLEGPGLAFHNQLALTTQQDQLIDLLNACMNSVGDLRESIATEIGRQHRIIEESQEMIGSLDEEKEALRGREKQADALRKEVDELAAQINRHQEHIGTLETGGHLLTETCRSIYGRFNQVLSKYTGKVMPKLTDNRYSQMQIGEDLGVRVFSKEKNDFGELEEFSSGTQRQMLLAVRLAMSKALIESTGQAEQFIILDEPFAFFDRERIRATLAALPKVDKHLDQIWIITQEFEELSPFALHIECSRDSEEMIVGQFTKS